MDDTIQTTSEYSKKFSIINFIDENIKYNQEEEEIIKEINDVLFSKDLINYKKLPSDQRTDDVINNFFNIKNQFSKS